MTDIPKATPLSYGCPYPRCKDDVAVDRGWVDPADARHHIATVHAHRREPRVIRWPHGVEAYNANDSVYDVGPIR